MASSFKGKFALKESKFFPLREAPYGMENTSSILQSSHLLLISVLNSHFVAGTPIFYGGYILMYRGTHTFWHRGLLDSYFQKS